MGLPGLEGAGQRAPWCSALSLPHPHRSCVFISPGYVQYSSISTAPMMAGLVETMHHAEMLWRQRGEKNLSQTPLFA